MPEFSVEEKQKRLRVARCGSAKIRAKFLASGGILAVGKGRGMEPEPLCGCHNRNPCPIDVELGLR